MVLITNQYGKLKITGSFGKIISKTRKNQFKYLIFYISELFYLFNYISIFKFCINYISIAEYKYCDLYRIILRIFTNFTIVQWESCQRY